MLSGALGPCWADVSSDLKKAEKEREKKKKELTRNKEMACFQWEKNRILGAHTGDSR